MKRLFPGGVVGPDSGMGRFDERVEVGNRTGRPFMALEALVDTGSTYTWIPRDVLAALSIVSEDDWPFILADGSEVKYPIAWITIRLRDRVQPTIVVFGPPASKAILGVVTLEEFRLAVDPVNHRLISVPALAKGAAA